MDRPIRGDWKRGSGKCDTVKIARVENAGVENAGVDSRDGKCRSKPYGTPIREYIEKALSYFVILVLILLTEQSVPAIALKIVSAFVFEIWWVVSDDMRVSNLLIISNTGLQSKERHYCNEKKQENVHVQNEYTSVQSTKHSYFT